MIRQDIEFVRTASLVPKEISEKSEELLRVVCCGIFQPWSTVWGRCALFSKRLFWSTALLSRWSYSSWSTGIDQKLTGLIRYGYLHLGMPGNLCLKKLLLIIVSLKCSRHKSRNVNTNSMFIVLTLNSCLQDYIF